MKPIPDYIKENLDILFVGFNPSIRSSETGYHFANPTNRFWKILHESGLTPRKFNPTENEKLLELGYGLTNIVERPTKAATDITKQEYEAGRQRLMQKINRYSPAIVCFVGKGVYQQLTKKKNVQWGQQTEPYLPRVIEFVAPSSSGLVRMNIDKIVTIYKQLHALNRMLNKED
ncbi:G/U mismatch-specific DNA glycosylase [Virgibacillus sp. W0430]|uniref:G/U mismatch-specific DNA glycosylase n=1 Tax=Virgibacillus sp. W0430 TaxID=3391580 RepID=UPI003F45E269